MLRARSLLLLAAAISVAGFSSGCKPSTSQEVSVGRQAAAQVERQYRVSTNAALNQEINIIGQTLAAQAKPRKGIEYTFKVLENKEINAFSLPGGWVYVMSGLTNAIGSDRDMLAGVIGHEIAHVAAGHYAEMMERANMYGIGIAVLTGGSTAQWASIFANINLLRWSRKDEYESDRLAIEYMYKSRRYDPNGVVRLLELLKREGGGSEFAPFLRTHPLTQDRIDRAKYWVQQYQSGRIQPT